MIENSNSDSGSFVCFLKFLNLFIPSDILSICRSETKQPLKYCLSDCSKKVKKKGYYKVEFCDFALRSSDCNLASSFSSKVVLSGRTERLAQRNKINLIIPLLFESIYGNPITDFPIAASVIHAPTKDTS